jgi:DNA-binding LacI/PurR family transcriptional regulator
VTRRANCVAFLLTESHERLFDDPNFSVLIRGASHELAEHDIPLVLIMAGTEAEQWRATEFITGGYVDGVLLVSSHSSPHSFMEEIVRSRIPAISCGVPLGFEKKIGYVTADDAGGAREMVAYLQQKGRKRIATITGPMDMSGGIGRLEGYRTQLGDLFDGSLVEHGDYTKESGARAMEALLERAPDIDAVFAANDLMAAGAVEALRARGRRIPEDVAVGGFDDSPVAASCEPPLTTIRQPFGRISAEMVRLLLQVIDGQSPAAITLPTELIVRASA